MSNKAHVRPTMTAPAGGGPVSPLEAFQAAAQGYALEALGVLTEIIRDKAATAATRLRAVGLLLERAFGRCPTMKPPPPPAPVRGPLVERGPSMSREEWLERMGALGGPRAAPG